MFPDVPRTIVDANVHLLERVAAHNHELCEQCVHASSNQQKTYEFDTWANYRCGSQKVYVCVFFLLLSEGACRGQETRYRRREPGLSGACNEAGVSTTDGVKTWQESLSVRGPL